MLRERGLRRGTGAGMVSRSGSSKVGRDGGKMGEGRVETGVSAEEGTGGNVDESGVVTTESVGIERRGLESKEVVEDAGVEDSEVEEVEDLPLRDSEVGG